MKVTKILTYTGLFLLVAGLCLLAPLIYYSRKNSVLASQPPAPIRLAQTTVTPTTVSGKPKQLTIPDLKIDVPVIDGTYNQKTGSWSLSLSSAHYALITALPNNDSGNTLIYGHYRPEVFARLHNIKPSQKAYIFTENGYVFTYEFTSAVTVSPTDTSLFAYQGPAKLTIQTCTGRWMQNRQLFSFSYVGYEKAN